MIKNWIKKRFEEIKQSLIQKGYNVHRVRFKFSNSYHLGMFEAKVLNRGYFETTMGYTIYVSKKYLNVSLEILDDTLKHEFAHALDYLERGKTDHSYHWKRWCKVTGADPKRLVALPDLMRPQRKYLKVCQKCGILKGQVSRKGRQWQRGKIHRKCGSEVYLKKNPKYKI